MTSEYWIGDNPIGNAWLTEPIAVIDGYVSLPHGPGLGLALAPRVLDPWVNKP
jgi:L-alanine-DL-glutamate epimerase-like enolase superfamily enzyme